MAATILATLAFVVAPQAFSQAFAQDAAPEGVTSDTYVVSQGDTLWTIAQAVTPSGGDVRDTVDTIRSMNLLESSTIVPGDQLLIPLRG